MDAFGTLLSIVFDLFCMEFTLLDFTFSFWQIFVFTIVADGIAAIIAEVFFDD